MNKEYNYLNLHVLMSHSPSCLNRDDMNMQKSAVFGGARRVRISSQCLKRAIRKSDYYRENIGEVSVRTRDISRLKDLFSSHELIKDKPKQDVDAVLDLLAGTGASKVVTPWSAMEVARLIDIYQKAKQEGLNDKQLEKKIDKGSKELRQAASKCLDIALSGRMAASGHLANVEAAAAVAHSITTHAVDAEIDWFTAMDDLTQEAEETGAGHLNTQEFGAGVFYRYAAVNIPQLKKNTGEDRAKALDACAHLAHLLATVVPTGKQNSFAAFNQADLVLACFSDQPLSAANAFETPVSTERNSGFIAPSIKALEDYWSRVRTGYGLNGDPTAVFSLWDTSLAHAKTTLAELEDWIRNSGMQKG